MRVLGWAAYEREKAVISLRAEKNIQVIGKMINGPAGVFTLLLTVTGMRACFWTASFTAGAHLCIRMVIFMKVNGRRIRDRVLAPCMLQAVIPMKASG